MLNPRLLFVPALLWGLLICPAFADAPLPRTPLDSRTLPAETGKIEQGRGWITGALPDRPGLHLNGPATVRFDLAALKLPPGLYHFGLIARTGTRWADAQDQIARYGWRLVPTRDNAPASGGFHLLGAAPFQPVRASGNPESWGNWYGTLQAARPVILQGGEHIEVTNRENHGGIIELWIQPATAANSSVITLHLDAPHHAFGHNQPPVVRITLERPAGTPRREASLALEWLDLLTGKTTITRLAVPAGTDTLTLRPDLKPGVHRLRVTVGPDGPPVENPASAQTFLACSAARPASELPDSWPLGAHVDTDLPPLPGFRWYRYFAQWAKTNPAPGRYDWTAFDSVFKSVQAAGGRLLIASDGSPRWTSARGKAGMPWEPAATAYPPDDWGTLRTYLDTMLARYTDTRGTLGAIELCNEANTPDRWLGDTAQMLAMARTFKTAAQAAPHPVQTIGLAISAGDQRGYVETLINAGLLAHIDAVSAHFYEELMSPESGTPINNLPRHVDMLAGPMAAAGVSRPMINTESGIEFAARLDGVPPAQNELNARDEADPRFDPKHPWLLGPVWRPVSERRAAAIYTAGSVQLLALGVRQTYLFSQLGLFRDGAPSLPWVALGQLGGWLHNVDTACIAPLEARYPGGDNTHGSLQSLAYRIGRPGGKQVIIAWGFLRDTRTGRSKHWQPWLDPRPLQIKTGSLTGTLHDLYDRTVQPVRDTSGRLTISCGEEPVCVVID
ncbi:MAG: hypothetical protein ACAH89_01840 [Rariglobus sp.]